MIITSTNSIQEIVVKNGTTWTATVTPDTGYDPGTLSPGSSGIVADDLVISITAATLKTFILTLAATTNQTITLTYAEPNQPTQTITSTNVVQSVVVPYGTTWTASVVGDTNYNPGTLSASSGTVIAATTVSVTTATTGPYTLTLAATTNQTITLSYTEPGASQVTVTSTSSNQSFTVIYGTTWTATVAGATGYDPGTLSAASGTIYANTTTISASEATLQSFTLTLAGTLHQTIALTYSPDADMIVTRTIISTDVDREITMYYGYVWEAIITADTGYNAGTLSASSGIISANTTVNATNASLKTYTLTLAGTENQTITLNYTEPEASQVTVTSTSSAQNFTVKHGTTYTATVAGATGYNPGTLSAASGTVTGNTTISTTAAIMYTNLNRYYENIPNYSSITSLPQNVIDALTNIIVGPDASYAFVGCALLTSIPCTNTWDTSNVVNMEELFSHLPKVTSIDLSTFNTSNVTNMNGMFNDCKSLVSLNLSNFNTSNVTEMNAMFADGFPLTSLDISSFNFSKVTTLFRFFNGASKLQTIIWPSTIDTSQITNMSRMFDGCTSLTTIPQLDTSKATNMSSMFYNCRSLTTIPQLDTSKATSMTKMFEGCTSLTTIPQLDTSKATEMRSMFYNCSSLPSTFPWVIDCSSIIDSGRLTSMFGSSSVTSVTLRNVNNSIRSQITSQLLKDNDTLTITFV